MNTEFDNLQDTWDYLGQSDPLWAILTDPRKRGNRWDVTEFFETGRHEVDAMLGRVRERFPEVPDAQALDFGCGVGRLTRALAEHFEHVIGIDVAESMIRRARELNVEVAGCEFVLNRRADLGVIASGSIDFVYSNIVLQHMEPMYAELYIQEFVRVLSPRGLAVFQVPYEHRLVYRSIPLPLRNAYRHIRYGSRRMQMHAIGVPRVEQVVIQAGGRVALHEESGAAGGRWKSKLYFVRPCEAEDQASFCRSLPVGGTGVPPVIFRTDPQS